MRAIEDQGNRLALTDKLEKIDFYNPLSAKSRKLAQEINQTIDKFKKIKNAPRDKAINKYLPKINYYHSSGDIDNVDGYTHLREFGSDKQNGLITLEEAKKLQRNMKKEIDELNNHVPKN